MEWSRDPGADGARSHETRFRAGVAAARRYSGGTPMDGDGFYSGTQDADGGSGDALPAPGGN